MHLTAMSGIKQRSQVLMICRQYYCKYLSLLSGMVLITVISQYQQLMCMYMYRLLHVVELVFLCVYDCVYLQPIESIAVSRACSTVLL